MNPAEDVILDFGNSTQRKMVEYSDGIFIDTAKMMKTLTEYASNHKIKMIQKKISSFVDIESKYIINYSGLGAANLNRDDKIVSVQGHLIMLKDQNPEDLPHMILVYFNEDKTKSGQKVKRSFYVLPKHLPNSSQKDVGVIGGTFIEGATKDTPNLEEFDAFLKGAKKFYGIDEK